MTNLPVLYSFRRCPYAIRARMALAYAGINPELREVVLKNKPPEMLEASAKGTVPVLVLADGHVLDESLDIIDWALALSDPQDWRAGVDGEQQQRWIETNDGPFKHWLDRYKYADRYPEQSATAYRDEATSLLLPLEQVLAAAPWLHGQQPGLGDIALFPFVRQFAMVDYDWFSRASLPGLQRWLSSLLDHPLFKTVMIKRPPWQAGDGPVRLLEENADHCR